MRESANEILYARNIGIVLITACLGIGMYTSEIQRLVVEGMSLSDLAYLMLFLVTGILVFLWIWATHKELNLMFKWLDPHFYSPPSTVRETILILFYAVLMVTMIFATRNPFWFGIVFTTYSFSMVAVERYVTNRIRNVIEKSWKRAKQAEEEAGSSPRLKLYRVAIGILDSYYLTQPIRLRAIAIAVCSTAGLLVATIWLATNLAIFSLLSNSIFILTILISEIAIARWRIKRDEALDQCDAELVEIDRQSESEIEEASARMVFPHHAAGKIDGLSDDPS